MSAPSIYHTVMIKFVAKNGDTTVAANTGNNWRRIHRSRLRFALFALAMCVASGCRPRPLTKTYIHTNGGPWCGPNQRVQIGQRVVGHVHEGNRWKIFLMDEAGKEYDPDKLAEQTWSYLERTGDAKRIKEAEIKEACCSSMSIVSLKPMVVILERHPDPATREQREVAANTWYWLAQISALRDPPYRDDLEWFSPDLKQRPTRLAFSEAGVAEIPLRDGKLKLIRDGNECKATRE